MEADRQGKRGQRVGYHICSAAGIRLSLLVPLSQRRFFFSNLVHTVRSWTDGTSTYPSSISVMIHPLPHIKTKKPRARVVRKALPMIDISQEDGEKDQEHSWWWWSGSYGVRRL